MVIDKLVDRFSKIEMEFMGILIDEWGMDLLR